MEHSVSVGPSTPHLATVMYVTPTLYVVKGRGAVKQSTKRESYFSSERDVLHLH